MTKEKILEVLKERADTFPTTSPEDTVSWAYVTVEILDQLLNEGDDPHFDFGEGS